MQTRLYKIQVVESGYRCNGADKTRGVQIHVQAFIKRHGQKHRQGRTTGKQVYWGQGR